MCLITIALTRLPNEEEMRKADKSNPNGIGFAYREGKEIRMQKGLTVDRAMAEMKKVPLPVVIHYRFATVGGKGHELCHPFPLTKNVPCSQNLKAPSVLFHNGHFSEWQRLLRETAIARNENIPDGPWSDSRAIAWVVARLGHSILHTLDGKFVYFDKEGCIFYGYGWCEVTENNATAMWHSNLTWNSKPVFPAYSAPAFDREKWEKDRKSWDKKQRHKSYEPWPEAQKQLSIYEQSEEQWRNSQSFYGCD